MKKWKFLLGVAVFVALALALAACGEEEEAPPATPTPTETATVTETATPTGEAPTGTVLVVGVPAFPFGLDHDISHGNRMTWEAMAQCHYNPQTFKVIDYDEKQFGPIPPGLEDELRGFKYLDFASGEQPGLGYFESWELAPDGKSATIKIRPGILSAVGNELTAEDVKWTVEKSIDVQVIGYFFHTVILKTDLTNPVEVIDKYTFKINSTVPNFLLSTIWSNSYFSVFDSKQAMEHATADDPWAHAYTTTRCAGFGSYYVEEWDEGNQVIFKRNPNYFGPAPYFETVIYKVIPESSSRLSALQAGDIDIATDLTPEQYKAAADTPGLKVIAGKGNINYFAFLNVDFPPWDDIRVRQAANYVAPRKEVAEVVFGGLATPWQCAYHCIYPGADPTLWPYGDEPDFAKAKELIDEYVADTGASLPLQVELSFSTAFDENEPSALLIKKNLEAIGPGYFQVTLNPMADGDYAAQTTALPHQTPFGLWFDTYIQPDPVYQLNLSFYDPMTIDNFGNMNDPQYKAILDDCTTRLSLEERIECTRPAQIRALELAGYMWLAEPFLTLAVREDLDGFVLYNTKFFLFKDVFERQ